VVLPLAEISPMVEVPGHGRPSEMMLYVDVRSVVPIEDDGSDAP
jgi:hypothetical protein